MIIEILKVILIIVVLSMIISWLFPLFLKVGVIILIILGILILYKKLKEG